MAKYYERYGKKFEAPEKALIASWEKDFIPLTGNEKTIEEIENEKTSVYESSINDHWKIDVANLMNYDSN